MKNQIDFQKCPFFDICAAYIIREKIEDHNRYKSGESTEKWSERFCFDDFHQCVHYHDRIKITEQGKRTELYPK